jgi:hypothetical protein
VEEAAAEVAVVAQLVLVVEVVQVRILDKAFP